MILTLDELAGHEVDVREYGLKAEGLAELIRMNQGKYIVDPGFAIPASFKLQDNPHLKRAFLRLLIGKREPRLFIARSSDKNEAPGVFESHVFMYSPGKSQEAYKDFIEAAEKVRASGAGGVICQMMDTRLSPIGFDYGEGFEVKKKDCFGADRIGFVYNSWSQFFQESPVINAVFGLVNKIVRAAEEDREVSLIFDSEYGIRVVNPEGNYWNRSLEEYEQREIDIVSPEKPKQVVSHHTIPSLKGGHPIEQLSCSPFWNSLNIRNLFNILRNLKTDERQIEIEGDLLSWQAEGVFTKDIQVPHLFQLRRYNLPQSRLERLAEVDKSRILLESDRVYAADRFSGNLVLLNEMGDWQPAPGQIVFAPDYHSVIYGTMDSTRKTVEFVKRAVESKARGLVIPVPDTTDKHYAAAHEFALMIQELWTLQKHIPVIAFDLSELRCKERELSKRFPERVEKKDYGLVIKNVTIESSNEKGQVYVN